MRKGWEGGDLDAIQWIGRDGMIRHRVRLSTEQCPPIQPRSVRSGEDARLRVAYPTGAFPTTVRKCSSLPLELFASTFNIYFGILGSLHGANRVRQGGEGRAWL